MSSPDQIALPDFNAGAMENWGLVTYRETALLYDPILSSTGNKERITTVISHELAHMVDHNISATWLMCSPREKRWDWKAVKIISSSRSKGKDDRSLPGDKLTLLPFEHIYRICHDNGCEIQSGVHVDSVFMSLGVELHWYVRNSVCIKIRSLGMCWNHCG